MRDACVQGDGEMGRREDGGEGVGEDGCLNMTAMARRELSGWGAALACA